MTAVTNQEVRDTVETGASLAAWRERAPAIVVAIVIIALWQACIDLFSVPIYIAPSPLVVAHEAFTRAPLLFQNMLPTLMEALVGFFAGNGAAVLFAILLVHNRTAERGFYPIAVFVHSIPILAIAPILVLLFGTGYAPKMIIASLLCFFPMLVNMVRGLKAVNPQAMELMQIISANRREIFFKLRLPSSLPFLFAALKVTAPACIIGAIVGEWIGSSVGLGALILEATFNFRSPLLYATIFLSSGLAIALFAIVGVVERRVIHWKTGEVH
jgi:NitT/TauT family transport system permease protein